MYITEIRVSFCVTPHRSFYYHSHLLRIGDMTAVATDLSSTSFGSIPNYSIATGLNIIVSSLLHNWSRSYRAAFPNRGIRLRSSRPGAEAGWHGLTLHARAMSLAYTASDSMCPFHYSLHNYDNFALCYRDCEVSKKCDGKSPKCQSLWHVVPVNSIGAVTLRRREICPTSNKTVYKKSFV